MCKCCVPSSDLPSLKTGLPHLLTKPWLEVGVPVLRLGRSEDGARLKDGASTQKLTFSLYFKIFYLKIFFYIFPLKYFIVCTKLVNDCNLIL